MKIAIIPARSGSKRIKNKNIKKFFGSPIISYSIKTAINSKIFDKVIVSTDSKIIAKIAKKYGAEVPFQRPKTLSNDFTGTNDVIKHAIRKLKLDKINHCFICCIYPTTPLLRSSDLVNGFQIFLKEKKNFCISVTRFESSVERSLLFKDETTIFLEKKIFNKRSQDFKKYYYDAGQFYWGTAKSFQKYNDVFKTSVSALKIESSRVVDINSPDDWKMAEIKYKLNK